MSFLHNSSVGAAALFGVMLAVVFGFLNLRVWLRFAIGVCLVVAPTAAAAYYFEGRRAELQLRLPAALKVEQVLASNDAHITWRGCKFTVQFDLNVTPPLRPKTAQLLEECKYDLRAVQRAAALDPSYVQ